MDIRRRKESGRIENKTFYLNKNYEFAQMCSQSFYLQVNIKYFHASEAVREIMICVTIKLCAKGQGYTETEKLNLPGEVPS